MYIYEHVTPSPNLKAGSTVTVGEEIATKTAPKRFTAHFQLSYTFNNYEFTRGMQCWVDVLNPSGSDELLTWWKKYRASDVLINAWRTNEEEGDFPFRGLLDATKFPEGPQLCYPFGTDVR